jgi:hypothetical protein
MTQERANPNRHISDAELSRLTDPVACLWLAFGLGVLTLFLNYLDIPAAVCAYPWLGGCATVCRAFCAVCGKGGSA